MFFNLVCSFLRSKKRYKMNTELSFCSATPLINTLNTIDQHNVWHSSLQNLDDPTFLNSVCFSSSFFRAFSLHFFLSLALARWLFDLPIKLDCNSIYSKSFQLSLPFNLQILQRNRHPSLFFASFQLFYFIFNKFPPLTLGLLLLLLLFIFQVHLRHVSLPCLCSRHYQILVKASTAFRWSQMCLFATNIPSFMFSISICWFT